MLWVTDFLANPFTRNYYSPRMYSRRVMQILYGAKERPYAFGYNSAESEPILMKSGTIWAKWRGLAPADFKRDPSSSDSFVFCPVGLNNERFCRRPVGKILHFNSTTSIGEVVKTVGTEFRKFYHKGSFFNFFPKNAKIAQNISRSCDVKPS